MTTTTTTSKKYFPIKIDPACPLKWNWSTLYIDSAHSACCHRTGHYPLTVENFDNFHNNPKLVEERTRMLDGQWPVDSCQYCQQIEDHGGFSDRMWHTESELMVTPELQNDQTAVVVTPSIVEVFFNNVCNMSCVYCSPALSSKINSEYIKFGSFNKNGVSLNPIDFPSHEVAALREKAFTWMADNLSKIKRLHILGGEPLFQPEFYRTLDVLEKHPCPDLELGIVTNLKHSTSKVEQVIARLKTMAINRCFKRIDITCSIDCWGKPQEYIRNGIDLLQWERNFELLLKNKWIKTSVNLTLSVLSVKTMPDLLEKINKWRESAKIGMSITGVSPNPNWLKIDIFGPDTFANDFNRILELVTSSQAYEQRNVNYIKGILAIAVGPKEEEIVNLYTFLCENDRRRGSNWREVFPWLISEFEKCGIVE